MSLLQEEFIMSLESLVDADQSVKDFIEEECPGFIQHHEELVSENGKYSDQFNKFSSHVRKANKNMEDLMRKDENGSMLSVLFAFVVAYPTIGIAKRQMKKSSHEMYQIYKAG